MNIEHLRKTLKAQWLNYYRENRSWLTRLGIWVNCEGKRRPSSSFILGALTTLEPQLLQILPLVVDLSSNPDRIILALGLNFNPDEEIEAIAELDRSTRSLPASKVTALSKSQMQASIASRSPSQLESSPELRSAHSAASPSAQPDPSETQVTVPVRKIVDPPESPVRANQAKSENSAKSKATAQAKAESKPEPTKPSGVPLPGVSTTTELPSRFPTNGGVSDPRSVPRRPPIDTAILSPGQLPDRNTSDPESASTVPIPDDARP